MKIVVLDGYVENPGDLSWEGFEKIGETVVYDRTDHEDEAEIIKRIGDAPIVITCKVPVTDKVMEACPGIRYIGVLATGYNIVDVEAAAKRGIPVTNVPTYGSETVAQYVFALLLEMCAHVGHHDQAVKEGRWENNIEWCFWDYPIVELYGKTLGIIGAGNIGQTVARVAQGFGMKVLLYSRTRKPEAESENCHFADLDTVLGESDVISLHCPLFPQTEGIINRENIAKMKDGAYFINTSRGPLVKEQDLADALNSGKLAGAAVDVVSTEPIKGTNPLLKAKNCLITPHVAWASREARQRIMDTAAENLKMFLKGESQNVINAEK